MTTIEPANLPDRLMLDTTVFMRAIGDRPADPVSPICRALLDNMQTQKRAVTIAAPTVSEVLRFTNATTFPEVEGLEVLNFDLEAAKLLGTEFPIETLKKMAGKEGGHARSWFLYDALIVATGKRHDVPGLVSLDTRSFPRLCEIVKLAFFQPTDVVRLGLFGPTT